MSLLRKEVFDMTREALVLAYPDNAILTDRAGRPTVMVYVPKFDLDEVISGAPHLPHPAFVVEGRVLEGIYLSKFQNVIVDGCAYSLPGEDPATHVDFDTAVNACRTKGEGYHLMTAMEWGALALWCYKRGWMPYGNNDAGRDIRETQSVALPTCVDPERAIFRVATGTGPVEWSHNHRPDGIYDLNGNVWEWTGGLRLVRGEVQILPDNNAASASQSLCADSTAWRAIDGRDGSLILPDGEGRTKNALKLDYVDGRWIYVCDAVSSMLQQFRFCSFADVTVAPEVCDSARLLLLALGCLPPPDFDDREVALYANNGKDERIPFRGGRWGQGRNAGLFKTCLDDPRTYSGAAVGFRSAYYRVD